MTSPEKAPLYGAFFVARAFVICLCLSVGLSACASEPEKVTVVKVIDGDTVRLQGGEIVRLLGINTPEKDDKDRPAEPLSLEASLLLTELVEDRTVLLTRGREPKDKYGRTLGYLDLTDGTDVQKNLISRGYAFAIAFPPDIDRIDSYLAAEKQARSERKGIWNIPRYFPAKPEDHKNLKNGFGLISGTVEKVRFSKKNVRLFFGNNLVIGIRHTAWGEFWGGDANKLVGKTVVARGWIQKAKKKKPAYLRVRHPAMMEIK